jgi:hypothetical protein
MKKLLLTLAPLLFVTTVQAQGLFNQIQTYGTGCPDGTVSTSISPDGQSMSVLFDEFRVEVPEYNPPSIPPSPGSSFPRAPRTRPTRAMRDCQLRFSATLPVGMSVESVEFSIQARGATILDPGITADFTSILVGYTGLAQARGRLQPIIQKQWIAGRSPVSDDWTASPSMIVPINSGCAGASGRSITFDLKNHLGAEITTGDLTKTGLVTVDSSDAKGILRVSLRTRSCRGVR